MKDVVPTIEAIRKMADTLRSYAKELDSIATRMDRDQDFAYAGEALHAISNCFSNLRIDLLATRPIRDLNKRIQLNKQFVQENKEGEWQYSVF